MFKLTSTSSPIRLLHPSHAVMISQNSPLGFTGATGGSGFAASSPSSSSKPPNKGNQRAVYQTAESRHDFLRKQREEKVIQVRKEKRSQLQSERRIVSVFSLFLPPSH